MSASYESAKRVALGFVRDVVVSPIGEDLWNVSFDVGGGLDIKGEMPFQFFEKGFEPPEEQVRQRVALMFFDDEYEQDRLAAERALDRLEEALASSDDGALGLLLAEKSLAEWLSLVFLDGDTLRDELTPLVKKASPACRRAFADAADKALEDLVEFKDLLKVLRDCCD